MTDLLEKIAIVAGFDSGADEVKVYVKSLASGRSVLLGDLPLVVLVGDEPTPGNAAALVQCRCSSVVACQYRQAGNGRDAVAMRRARDIAMFDQATRVVVFGTIAADREATLQQFVSAGRLSVERRNG